VGPSGDFETEQLLRRAYRRACEKYHQYAERCRAARHAITDHCRASYEQYGRWKYIKRLIATLTVIGVWVYTGLTGCLLDLTSTQLAVSRKSFIASQRAFVYLDKIEAAWLDTKTAVPGKIINVTFFIGNSGNTPTDDLRMVAGCYSLGPDLPREPYSAFTWDEKRIAHLVIAPHQVLPYPACRLTEKEIDPLQSSPFIQRYFMGEIRYFDIVSDRAKERITQFAEELAIHDFDAKANRLNYETLLAGLHNCSDDECKKAQGDPGALAAPRWITR
jgi:hypothetical protein